MPRRLPPSADRPHCCGKPMASKGCKAESGRDRYICTTCRRTTTNSGEATENVGYDVQQAAQYHAELQADMPDVLIVTSAVNNTRKNAPFFNSLMQALKDRTAKLVILPVNYKNVTAFTSNETFNRAWAKDLQPYIIDKPLKFGQVMIRPDIKIPATAAAPLSGKESINGNMWTIFGGTKFAMETVCDMKNPKRMYTAGAITVKNYSQTNVGAKAEFHHVCGALILERKGRDVFIRHLNADNKGCFYDLDRYYTPKKVTRGHRIKALIPGDEHVKFNKKSVRRATYDNINSMVKILKPEFIVRHDVLDSYAGSHHHEKDDVLLFRKHHNGDNNFRKEVDQAIKFIDDTTPKGCKSLIVASNHTDHLYQWLSRVDPKKDPTNALFIHELKKLQYENSARGAEYDGYYTDPFKLYAETRLQCKFSFLQQTKEYLIAGIDIGQHGHIGANGSRGSANGMAKSVNKMFIGHGHTARVVLGVYQVATSTGRRGHERGLSSSTNTHGIIYKNGKRALIDIIKSGWRK